MKNKIEQQLFTYTIENEKSEKYYFEIIKEVSDEFNFLVKYSNVTVTNTYNGNFLVYILHGLLEREIQQPEIDTTD